MQLPQYQRVTGGIVPPEVAYGGGTFKNFFGPFLAPSERLLVSYKIHLTRLGWRFSHLTGVLFYPAHFKLVLDKKLRGRIFENRRKWHFVKDWETRWLSFTKNMALRILVRSIVKDAGFFL